MRTSLTAWATTAAAPTGTLLRWLVAALPGLTGLLLVSYGAWLAWPPAGFITPGALLLADRAWTRMHEQRSVL
ncbi:hypothetical protein AB0B89_23660 [Sphaerisporangium sp. NPDC049002]|uniref:hypothetical protein n=1 Tax=Sphaerisporangium sp. NPDC049002 TaxID=3155392 RepID=UPI003407B014